eukprot:TRINITY_DN52583_c0_g1_i1.p2 TRINITY_DN52583_c0_g1~~TRINITY_DN52583_c0_g1_i1.p2  ORF type:complete len:140 (+),score=29.99 TRINITY_DN52583_c0_g1_i1:96-515(+)
MWYASDCQLVLLMLLALCGAIWVWNDSHAEWPADYEVPFYDANCTRCEPEPPWTFRDAWNEGAAILVGSIIPIKHEQPVRPSCSEHVQYQMPPSQEIWCVPFVYCLMCAHLLITVHVVVYAPIEIRWVRFDGRRPSVRR